jgi:hypothetical protein
VILGGSAKRDILLTGEVFFNGTEDFGRKKCCLTELRALGGRSVV